MLATVGARERSGTIPLVPDLDERRPLELRDYVNVLRRRAWIVIAIVLICAAGSVGISLAQTKKYRSGTRHPDREPTLDPGVRERHAVRRPGSSRGDREAGAPQRRGAADAAAKELGHQPDVSVDPATDPTSSPSPPPARAGRGAVRDANVYARTYVEFRRTQTVDDLTQAGTELQAKITEIEDTLSALPADSAQRAAVEDQRSFLSEQLDRVEVSANVARASGAVILAKADVPKTPSSPLPARNGGARLALGLLLGIGVAFLLEYFDDRIKSKDDLERAAHGVPVLGEIPVVRNWRKRGEPVLVSIEDPSVGGLRRRTARCARRCSSSASIATCAASRSPARARKKGRRPLSRTWPSHSRRGQSVVVICCDLRRPRLHEFFGLSNSIGFTSVLLGDVTLTKALALVPEEGKLAVLPSGPPPPNPSELLASARTREVLDQLKQSADIVLVDSPPLLPVSDGIVLANLVDATIVVAKAGSSSRRRAPPRRRHAAPGRCELRRDRAERDPRRWRRLRLRRLRRLRRVRLRATAGAQGAVATRTGTVGRAAR